MYLVVKFNDTKAELNSVNNELRISKSSVKELEENVRVAKSSLNNEKLNAKGLEERLDAALEQIRILTTPVLEESQGEETKNNSINGLSEILYELSEANENQNNNDELESAYNEANSMSCPEKEDSPIGVESWLYAEAPKDVKKSITVKSYQEMFGAKPQWVLRLSKDFLDTNPKIKRFLDDPESAMVRNKRDGTVIIAGIDL